ncbi:hypothetical protein IX335_001458 [Porphyromonas levii]|nr:hypothetical protein [Porphyromonas levii]
MNKDPHEPAFLPFDKQAPKAPPEAELSKSQLIRWRLRQLFPLALFICILYGGYRLLAKILTPEVLTVIGIIAGFLTLRWIVRIVLRIAFTIFSLVFWLVFICVLFLLVF